MVPGLGRRYLFGLGLQFGFNLLGVDGECELTSHAGRRLNLYIPTEHLGEVS